MFVHLGRTGSLTSSLQAIAIGEKGGSTACHRRGGGRSRARRTAWEKAWQRLALPHKMRELDMSAHINAMTFQSKQPVSVLRQERHHRTLTGCYATPLQLAMDLAVVNPMQALHQLRRLTSILLKCSQSDFAITI